MPTPSGTAKARLEEAYAALTDLLSRVRGREARLVRRARRRLRNALCDLIVAQELRFRPAVLARNAS